MTPNSPSPKPDFLFDIGKVLLDFDFESSLSRLLPPGANDGTRRLERLLDRKDDFEGGRVSLEDYLPWCLEVLEIDVPHERFIHAWRHIFTPNLPMWEAVDKLHARGHRLILFSNTNPIHCPWIFEEYPIFEKFDRAVLSFEVGTIKPDPLIYRHAIETHALDPANTLYIDDLPANIETGKSLGFRTHLYDAASHAAFETWLSEELASVHHSSPSP